MSTFSLPDLGEGLSDAEILAWHVCVGDHVVADQPLVSVETQKAVVDIPSPQSGQITALHGNPGDLVPVGATLVEFDDQAGAAGADSVVGDLPHAAVEPHAAVQPQPSVEPQQQLAIKAAPAVRQLARKRGVDLNALTGTGPNGAISLDDVRAVSANPTGEPLRGPRRSMAETLSLAARDVVPATVTADADITQWEEGADPTVRMVRAIVAGCHAEPALNAWYDTKQGLRIVHRNKIDVGLAVDTPMGLIVPVIRDADSLTPREARACIQSLKQRVLARTIGPEDLMGATITFSNFGTLIGRYANLVIVAPQVAIIGAGLIAERVVVVDHRPAVRTIMPLSLTFDHRIVTGAEAARFLGAVIRCLENEDLAMSTSK